MLKKILYLLLICQGLTVFGQKTILQHNENELSKLYQEEYNRKKEIRLEGKKYRIYSNYLTLGGGKGYNSGWKEPLFVPAIDFNFHIKKTFFQLGGMLQGHSYGNNQIIQFHGGVGYHKESYKYFWAAYGGLSYTDGYYPQTVKDVNGKDSILPLKQFAGPGVYIALQAFYKVKFDYGIGLTLFGDVNAKQYIVGARIELFFSGAFRGNILHKDDDQ